MNKFAQSLTGLAAAGFLMLSASVSHAKQVCAPRGHTLGQLEKKHQEHVSGRGLTPDGKAMFELFISKTGSWTVLASKPDGRSCFVAAGDSWHQIKMVPGKSVEAHTPPIKGDKS